ncbi:spermidine synthase [Deinococcus wulumuqiensis]|uniref:spermidine synthase n=1 Tax=Deinococcus wulumuqiensis TaxID=980427 RepID=UPI0013C3330D|nr:hypothetical protein [Deinococcus wulumuqiensis]
MIPRVLLGSAPVPGGEGELQLFRRGADFAIAVSTMPGELMNSRMHASEDALARLGCAPVAARRGARVLVGGLGMGFTLAEALRSLGPDARVLVAELVPQVVEWNRGELGECAGWPLRDPRVEVRVGDVGAVMGEAGPFDAVLLDVDNGPEGLTRDENGRLYSPAGLRRAWEALRPGGVLAVWSAHPVPAFTRKLERAGFAVRAEQVRERVGKGAVHTVWLGEKG